MTIREMKAAHVFHQQNGEVTTAWYRHLAQLGPIGVIALNLFRAQKRSSRAKDYRRSKYRHLAYDVKEFAVSELCRELTDHGGALGFVWGWLEDPGTILRGEASWVLYVDIPHIGQVSFHAPARGKGPGYPRQWDGQKGISTERILSFCDYVLTGEYRGVPVQQGLIEASR